MGKTLEKVIGGLTELVKGSQGDTRTFDRARIAPRAAVLPRAPKVSSEYFALFSYSFSEPTSSAAS